MTFGFAMTGFRHWRRGFGLLVPVKDAIALANAIKRLHQNPALARQLGQAARARALREFDERIVIRQTLAVYGELLEERGGPAPE